MIISAKIQCPYCTKKLAGHDGVYSHVKTKHPNKKPAHLRPKRDEEPSMADLFIDAQINRSMGITNDDWIEDMLP